MFNTLKFGVILHIYGWLPVQSTIALAKSNRFFYPYGFHMPFARLARLRPKSY